MTTTSTAARCACGKPSPGATICPTCEHHLQLALITAALLAADLNAAVARQSKFATTSGRTRGHPLPYDVKAAESADLLRKTLVSWCSVIARLPAA